LQASGLAGTAEELRRKTKKIKVLKIHGLMAGEKL
jgi:hypothetical protein